MTIEHYTTGNRKFKHLTLKKRAQIEILLKQGMKKTKIAKEVGISRSTLYEELKRGTTEQIDTNLKSYKKYFSDLGQKRYEEHRKNSRKPYKFERATEFIRYAEEKILKEKLSPDAVCGFAKKNNLFKDMVCTRTLYNYIDLKLLEVRNIDLPLRVKLKNKIRKVRQNRRILGKSIEIRPESINNRTEFGHWEIDTVVGKRESSPVLLTLDERLTRKLIVIKIASKTASAVAEGIKKLLSIYGERSKKLFKSITSDNGSEFSKLSEVLPFSDIYYAHPYSSFERGTNEKQNSLIRRFFPKGKSFDDVSDFSISSAQDWINNLPRKIFNYSSSNDLFSVFINNL